MTAIYTRQSIEKKDSLSIENQIELCKKECEKDEYKIYEDRGFSGKNTNRPSFEELLKDVESGQINKIVVYRIDRFSRSVLDFGQIWLVLKEKGVKFISVSEKFDTSTPMGMAMLQIIMVFAQLERETIAERVTDNYYQRARSGAWVGGPAPYGFTVTKQLINGKSVSVLEKNKKIEVVKQIFYLYAEPDMSLGKLAKLLNEEKIPCAQRKNWDNVSVARILHSPLYVMADKDVFLFFKAKGAHISQEIEEFNGECSAMLVGKRDRSAKKYTNVEEHTLSLAIHQGEVPSDIWLKCQYKLERNSQLKNTGKGKYTWLSGLLKCGKCGYSLKIVKSRNSLYMNCSGKVNLMVCDYKQRLTLQEIERSVQSEIMAMLKDCSTENINVKVTEKVFEYRRLIEENNQKIQRLISAISDGNDASSKYIHSEIERLDSENSGLVKLMQVELAESSSSEFQNIDFENLSFEEKKIVVSRLINRVQVREDEIEIMWKI